MKIDLEFGNYAKEDLVIYPISIESLKGLENVDAITDKACQARDMNDFKGKNDEICCIALDKKENVKRVILVGLGDNKTVTEESLRRALSVATNKAQSLKIENISVLVQDFTIPDQQLIASVVEGIELSNYVFQKYINNKDRQIIPITSLKIYCKGIKKSTELSKVVKETQTICKYTNVTRDLVNENSNQKYSTKFVESIKEHTDNNKLEIVELGEDKLQKLKMNLILAVNSGSNHPPKLLEINYTGNPKSSKRIALVGKGVTFDTGGLNLKQTKFIEDMKLDMAGAATVASIINCAAELKLKQNITAIIPLVENMIGKGAYKPGDIFESYSKKTVEIRNTDAEGRLILADALAYTVDKHKPDLMIDIATLTGACLVALGEHYAGVMSNNQEMMDQLLKSSGTTSETIWQLPLYDDLAKSLKSDIADLQNSSPNRFGGTIFGGLFLKEFVGTTPWIHIDFAGPAFFEKTHYYMKKGGTGFGVRLMIDFLKNVKL